MATDVLTREEVGSMIRAAGKGRTAIRNQALLVLMWRTGLRLAEALALRPSDVAAAGTVHVRRGKGGKSRTVPIDPGAMATLREYFAARGDYDTRRGSPLFCTLAGGALQPQYVQQLCTRLAERAELEKHVHPHMLRHTYACELMREGFNAAEIMALLGHSDLRVTTQYLARVGTPAELVGKVHARESVDLLGEHARARVVGIAASVRKHEQTRPATD